MARADEIDGAPSERLELRHGVRAGGAMRCVDARTERGEEDEVEIRFGRERSVGRRAYEAQFINLPASAEGDELGDGKVDEGRVAADDGAQSRKDISQGVAAGRHAWLRTQLTTCSQGLGPDESTYEVTNPRTDTPAHGGWPLAVPERPLAASCQRRPQKNPSAVEFPRKISTQRAGTHSASLSAMPHPPLAELDNDLLALCMGGSGDGYASGGWSESSFTFDDGSTVTYGWDVTSTAAPDDPAPSQDPVDDLIRDMSPEPNDWNADQDPIDTTVVVAHEMSEADAAAQQRDLTLNFRDGASPPEVFQGSGPVGSPGYQAIGNCSTVSVTNEILAQPGGPEYIQSLMTTNADGSVTFALPGGNQTVWPGQDNFAWSPNGTNDPAVLFTTAMAYQQGQVPTLVDRDPAVIADSLAGRWPDNVMTAAGLVDVVRADGAGAMGEVRVVDGLIGGYPELGPHAFTGNGGNPWGFANGVDDVRLSYAGNLPSGGPTGGGGADFGALNNDPPPDLP